MTELTDTERREVLEDTLYDLLDAAHDQARHVHAAECCWPFPGAIAALGSYVAAREAAAVEAALEPVRALVDEWDEHSDRLYDEARTAEPTAAIVLRSKSGTYAVNAERLAAVLPPAPTEGES